VGVISREAWTTVLHVQAGEIKFLQSCRVQFTE